MKSLRVHPFFLVLTMIGFFLFLGSIPFSGSATQLSRTTPTVLYVKPDASGDCSSWENACDLLTAVSTITSPGELWVAAGTYTHAVPVELVSGVGIYGGFPADGGDWASRNWETNVTTLDGNNVTLVVTADHVDNTAILDGFTITNGWGETYFGAGGLNLWYSDPILTNLIITGNTSKYYGGGLYALSSNSTLSNVTFSNNYCGSGWGGGGMTSYDGTATLSDVSFMNNEALESSGGGFFYFNKETSGSASLTNVSFIDNTAGYWGGGMYVFNNGETSLTNVTFTNNEAAGNGGGLYLDGSPYEETTIISAVFTENSAGRDGGGLYFKGLELNLTGIDFINNTANNGGGLFTLMSSGTITSTDVLFSGNQATSSGGGFYQNGGTSTLSEVDFSNNTAGGSGGGVYGGNSLTDVTFSGNTAGGDGGGKYGDASQLINATFSNNSAGGKGGGIYGEVPIVTNVSFTNNSSVTNGGGMYMSGKGTFTDVIFSGNQAGGPGGGLWSYGTLTRVQFIENTSSTYGGGMYGDGVLTDVIFENNMASFSGGGMYMPNYGNNPSMENVVFSGNTAGEDGGGLFCFPLNGFSISGATFSGNTANQDGGGLWVLDQGPINLILTNVTISNNTALRNGGGMRIFNRQSYTIQNSTITGNTANGSGGGIYLELSDSGAMSGSILWANLPDQIAQSNTYTPDRYNLETTNSIVQGGREGAGNLDLNPKLLLLADNGGPTQTHALRRGSPAIDALDPALCPAIDQRGFTRPIDGDADEIAMCDMGAYEAGEIIFLFYYLPMLLK